MEAILNARVSEFVYIVGTASSCFSHSFSAHYYGSDVHVCTLYVYIAAVLLSELTVGFFFVTVVFLFYLDYNTYQI